MQRKRYSNPEEEIGSFYKILLAFENKTGEYTTIPRVKRKVGKVWEERINQA